MARLTKPWSPAELRYIDRNISADLDTGQLFWKVDSIDGKRKAGDPVNTSRSGIPGNQYLIFAVSGLSPVQKNFKVHHVIWYLATGKQCKTYLDHIDRDTLNNSIHNLREATASQNGTNREGFTRKPGQPTYKGVTKRERADRGLPFWSTIRANEQSVYLGTFRTAEQAAEAYDLASIVLHGEYGVTNFPRSKYTHEQIDQMSDYIGRKLAAKAISPTFQQLQQQVTA